MYLLRSVSEGDLDDLFDLSKLELFINLPRDKKLIKHKIQSSLKSFKNPSEKLYKNYYIFVLEDLQNNKVIGTSMIHAQHGTEEEPHFYLSVSQEHKFSRSINTGFVHGTLKLGYETNGPTEIGGLILNEKYRSRPEKLGKQLSFVRFLYMGMFPERFKEEIHSELLPPFDENGNSPLWEAIGRRFMNMEYHEADLLSRKNKEFILNLYPSDTIYQTLLPIEARNAIGEVGYSTLPVKKMLESIGFRFTNEVDPFDGGPHYRCKLKETLPVKKLIHGNLDLNAHFNSQESQAALFSFNHPQFDFAALLSAVNIVEDLHKKVIIPCLEAKEYLKLARIDESFLIFI